MEKPPSSSGAKPSPSSHRLPTVSASDALKSLQANGPRTVATGLGSLDSLLSNKGDVLLSTTHAGGLERGKITEVWGPPGAGKTAFAMQTATNTLKLGRDVVWVDISAPLASPRLLEILSSLKGPSAIEEEEEVDDPLHRFHRYTAPTMPHLMALILHPPASFLPANTTLLVIDGLHAIFNVAYPRHQSAYSIKIEAAKWAAGRRFSVLGSLVGALKKMAALNDLAVLITTGCATRARAGNSLLLTPGVGGTEWESGVTNRLVLFRDFPVKTHAAEAEDASDRKMQCARFLGAQKVGGVAFAEEGETGRIIIFEISRSGLKEVQLAQPSGETSAVMPPIITPIKSRKRPHAEVADSDDEDLGSEYGWLDEDEVAAEGLIDECALTEGLTASGAEC